MRPTARLLAGVVMALSAPGCSQAPGQADRDRSPAAQSLAEKDVLERARAEIRTRGFQLPDETMMSAVVGLGFHPKVTPSGDIY